MEVDAAKREGQQARVVVQLEFLAPLLAGHNAVGRNVHEAITQQGRKTGDCGNRAGCYNQSAHAANLRGAEHIGFAVGRDILERNAVGKAQLAGQAVPGITLNARNDPGVVRDCRPLRQTRDELIGRVLEQCIQQRSGCACCPIVGNQWHTFGGEMIGSAIELVDRAEVVAGFELDCDEERIHIAITEVFG